MDNTHFSKQLAYEMAEFRRVLLVRACRKRGYKLDDEQLTSLHDNTSATLQQKLMRAKEMEAERQGFFGRLWRRWGSRAR